MFRVVEAVLNTRENEAVAPFSIESSASMPVDQNGFFQANGPEANFEFWAKQPNWSVREAAPLFLGLNPEWVLTSDGSIRREGERFRKQLTALMDMIHRAFVVLELPRIAPPSRWMAWAKSRGVPHSSALDALVAEWDRAIEPRDQEIETLKAELEQLRAVLSSSDKPVGTRERESLYKLILGMAIGGYGYKAAASRNSIISDIEKDLVEHELSLTDDTIRSYLQKAVQHLEKHDL